jgi:prevent-host-death family protein
MKIMSVRDARANFSELLGSVYYTGSPVVVEKKGKTVAVMVSPRQFRQLEKIKDEGWAVIDEIRTRNKDKDPDEVYKEVTKIVEEVRQEMYDREQKKLKRSR